MKCYIFAAFLFLGSSTFASINTPLTVQCNGNIGSSQVGQTLQFANGVDVQDIATVNGVTFSVQLALNNNVVDMLILKNVIDATGSRNLSSYVVGHGATELDYVDNVNQTMITCVLNSDL
jgi:hypothetical protein